MSRLWWQLPGPDGFVADVAQNLRDGKNVIIHLPEHAPGGLDSAVRSGLSEQEERWQTIRLSGLNGTLPVDLLLSYFPEPEARRFSIQTAATFLKNERFVGKVIWLDGITRGAWPGWEEFLSDYGHACQHCPIDRRTVFCALVPSGLVPGRKFDEEYLTHRYWRGVVSHLDMMLYASHMLHGKRMNDLQRRVAVSVAASLSLWDPVVCERMAREELENIIEPLPLLERLATERGWNAEACRPPGPSWEGGMRDYVDGRLRTHSAALVFGDARKKVERRVWSAQVSVLMPLIEEARQAIIRRCGGGLEVPYQPTKKWGVLDLFDLEINHINRQLNERRAILDQETQRLVRQLTAIRNRISHLSAVPADMLGDATLNDFVERKMHGEF